MKRLSRIEKPIPPTHLSTFHPVRPATAARLNAWVDQSWSGSMFLTVGNIHHFHRDSAGIWTRERKRRNPKYWDVDTALIVCDVRAPNPMPMLRLRYPRRQPKKTIIRAANRLLRRLWQKGLFADGHVVEMTSLQEWRATKAEQRYQLDLRSKEFRKATR